MSGPATVDGYRLRSWFRTPHGDGSDRRAKIVSITDMGRTVISAAQQPQHKTIEAIFAVLTEEQKQQLKEIIRCLSEKTEALQRERDKNAGAADMAPIRSLEAVD